MGITGLDIKFEDLPEWARKEIGKHIGERKRPHTWLVVGKVAHVGGTSSDYNRTIVIAYGKGQFKTEQGCYYESMINATPTQRAVYMGGKVELPEEGAMIQIETGYPRDYVWFYVHPNGPWAEIGRLIAGPEQLHLNPVQEAVLHMIVGLNSRGRKDELDRNWIPVQLYEHVCQELAEKQLVKINKAGAVRAEMLAHQVRDMVKGGNYWYQWYRDKEKVNEITTLYPQFKEFIEKRLRRLGY